jgi:transcriptional regulator
MMESRYTEGDVTKILRMRDNGESLKTVAAEVGGTRQEVKCAERSAITAKRNARFVQK